MACIQSLSLSLSRNPEGSAKAERRQVYSLYISRPSFKRFKSFKIMIAILLDIDSKGEQTTGRQQLAKHLAKICKEE